MANAVAVAERATSELLSVPNWAMNAELCDIVKADPAQGKEALKIIKKKLGHKNHKMQILALFVLDALAKKCGANIFHQMIAGDILRDMVKIVKEKHDLNVREKIVEMINNWQSALGGIRGKFPQYYDAYNELKSAGVEFPPRVGNNLPWFTPPTTHLLSYSSFPYETGASILSLVEIKTAERVVDVLTEMLAAMDPNNSQGVKDELIVDLVVQCRAYQKLVTVLVNNTEDEGLLCAGLQLYDRLQLVLRTHDNIASGMTPEVRLKPFMNVNHEDEESDYDCSKLTHGSSKPAAAKTGSPCKDPFSFGALLTSIYGPPEEPLIKPSPDKADPTVKNHSNGAPAAGYLPPPPSRYNQRQHLTRGSSHSTNHFASSENLSTKSTNIQQQNPGVSMYKYAIDLANAKLAEAKAMK